MPLPLSAGSIVARFTPTGSIPVIGGLQKFALETLTSRGLNLPFFVFGNVLGLLGGLIGGVFGGLFGGGGGTPIPFPDISVRIHGLKELQRAFGDMSGDLNAEINRELRILSDRGLKFAVSEASALGLPSSTVGGYKASVARATSKGQWAKVRQSRRKTTGLRPDYAELQQRHIFDPLEASMEREVHDAFERAIDRAARKNGF